MASNDDHLRPLAPELHRELAVSPRAHSGEGRFPCQQVLEAVAPIGERIRRVCCAERAPEAGHRRKCLRAAAGEIHSWASAAPQPAIYWGAGDVLWDIKVIHPRTPKS